MGFPPPAPEIKHNLSLLYQNKPRALGGRADDLLGFHSNNNGTICPRSTSPWAMLGASTSPVFSLTKPNRKPPNVELMPLQIANVYCPCRGLKGFRRSQICLFCCQRLLTCWSRLIELYRAVCLIGCVNWHGFG